MGSFFAPHSVYACKRVTEKIYNFKTASSCECFSGSVNFSLQFPQYDFIRFSDFKWVFVAKAREKETLSENDAGYWVFCGRQKKSVRLRL